ncbi:uncharacterized protein LOC111088246 [Limulus polyphemus]|uniref:Glycosyltransferase family 92 protein n=1 Tax=Limulus polyphemus TaxID=6850 RepID=A0ABM1TC72_LIMPO|nr:uncharacterized protein LOC111088246 [Limulus polyphemus]
MVSRIFESSITQIFQHLFDLFSKAAFWSKEKFTGWRVKRVVNPYIFAYSFRKAKALVILLAFIPVYLFISNVILSSKLKLRVKKIAPTEWETIQQTGRTPKPSSSPPFEPEGSFQFNWIGVQEANSWTDNWVNVKSDLDIYSAYFDNRSSLLGGPVIRIIAKTETKLSDLVPNIECWAKFFSPEREEHIVKIQMNESDIDKIHNACNLICSNEIFRESVPTYVGVKSISSYEDPIWIKVHIIPNGSVDSQVKIAVCVPPFNGSMKETRLLAEFVSFYSVLGVRHFSFYDYGTTTKFRRLLDVIAQSKGMSVNILPWTLTWETNKVTYPALGSSFAYYSGLQDCGYRHMHHYSHLMFLDIEDFLTPVNLNHTTLVEVIQYMDANGAGICCDVYRFTQSIFCLKFPSFVSPFPNSSNFVTFSKRIARPAVVLSSMWPAYLRYIVRPDKAVLFGPHDSYLLPKTSKKNTQNRALVHRYLDLPGCDFNQEKQKVIYVDLIPNLYGEEMVKIMSPWLKYI